MLADTNPKCLEAAFKLLSTQHLTFRGSRPIMQERTDERTLQNFWGHKCEKLITKVKSAAFSEWAARNASKRTVNERALSAPFRNDFPFSPAAVKAKECEAQSTETAGELTLRLWAIKKKKDDNETFYFTIVKTLYEIRLSVRDGEKKVSIYIVLLDSLSLFAGFFCCDLNK